ncbi:uncharacterized protein K02A2.6-like [Ornithodoros turicata]|uniref:uncharacterized protein K02A2.6-like n=1 Tax=Ornithodoros turicata TaxID=34597 RepID=UPI0031399533
MHNGNGYELPLLIAKNRGNSRMPTLLGRDWLRHLRLNWPQIANVNTVNEKVMVESYRDVFTKNMGVIKNFSASIVLKEGARPVFCKARPVPYALRDKVEKELRELEKQGVISPVQQSQWATPLDVVPKNGGNGVRLCGDYRVTVNPAITVAHYPLPLPEDVFASLSGGTHFTVLDLSKAYLQLEDDESSRELLTVNTSLGLFRMNRLPFGIASAPSIFQSVMDQITTGLQGVACYLDDVLIAGRDCHECVERTEKVLERLRNHGIKVNSDKCQFFRSKVTYLGHEIDKDDLRPTSDKLKAIREAPTPSNVTELKAFLGLLNFYSRFLPNTATVLEPLYKLLKKNAQWQWSADCENSFKRAKELLQNSQVLALYDSEKPLKVTCDASSYGLGVVLSQYDGETQ